MAATTDPKSETLSYAEHDKLGPLGGRPSTLHDPAELRAKLLGEFSAAVAAARDAAASADREAATAVHSSRKALRRARAVLSMIAGALPKSERRAVRAALQEARRSLSTVRDHTVAPETLAQLELGEEDRATARRVLDSAAEAIPAIAEIKQLLAEAAARAAAQADALAAALPPGIEWKTVAGGIAEIYGQARVARRGAKRSKQSFHTWRRRTKELAHQLHFVAKHAGPRSSAIHAEIDGIGDTLGPVVDLIMLREFVETHGQGTPAEAVESLRDSIDATLEGLMKSTRSSSEARDAFRQKPKKFERRLAKSIKRDLTPADHSGPNGEAADAD